jgi:RHS repeat-associated protein
MAASLHLLRQRLGIGLALVLALALRPLTGQAQTGTNLVPDSTEMRILRQLYVATGGPQGKWTTSAGSPWNTITNQPQPTLPPTSAWGGTVYVTNGDINLLNLSGVGLTGALPASLGQLTQLQVLGMHSNSLSGALPTSLGNLTRLTSINLANNLLTGTLPASLGQLTQLTLLSLANNHLSGVLPSQLESMTALTELNLSGNGFTGSLPASLGVLPVLENLYLNNNDFSGPLPRYFFNELWNLRNLRLGTNHFTGVLSASLAWLPRLYSLDVTNNQFSGPLPPGFEQCPQLYELQLGTNQFSGALPAAWAQSPSLRRLFLNNNQFTGELPAEWGQLPLTWLEASTNQLTGPLPASYANFPTPYWFNLSNNRLSGPIPAGLTGTYVKLANNRFSGELPASYATTQIGQLGLESNNLTAIPGFTQPWGFAGVTGNYLDFGSYEPNLVTPGVAQFFDYGQRTPGPPDTLARPIGTIAQLSRTPGGQHTVYQWERRIGSNWVPLPGETGTTLQRGPLTEADEGEYRLRTTNTWVVNMVRYPRSIYLTLLPAAELPFNEPSAGPDCPALLTTTRPVNRTTTDSVNYVRTYAARVALTTPRQLRPSIAADSAQVQTTYLDGLGRPVQTVAHRAAPSGRDIVQLHQYDALGREPKAYLPYTADPVQHQAQPEGYYPNALRQQYDFHAGLADAPLTANLPKTGVAFAETVFEPSPLNRVQEQAAPGEAWQLVNNRVQELTERPSVLADSVPHYQPRYGDSREVLDFVGLYADGELWRTETRDEDFNRTQRYTDKQGQTVLVRTSATKWREAGTNLCRYTWQDTWYVYDDFNRPRATVPPLAARRVRDHGYLVDGAGVDQLLFRTQYDERGRVVESRTPDVDGYARTVYDALDRPILTQDAAQAGRGEWLATKYDALGRPVLTALAYYPAATSRDSLQARATRAGNAAGARLYEEPAASGPVQFYTDAAFPVLTTAPAGGRVAQVLTVSYYDGYDFDQNGQPDVTYSTHFARHLGSNAPVADLRVTGQPTRTRILGNPTQWLTSTLFYDDELRPVQVQATNARGGSDTVATRYDFTGKALATYAQHTSGPGQAPVSVRDTLTYDATGRLLTQQQRIDDQPAERLLANRYNEAGQLARQSLRGALDRGLQNVDYGYSIRGWLARLNDPALRGEARDLWGFELSYECGMGTPAFNGNLSGQRWRSRADTVERAYGYRYDAANRLRQGDFVARAGASQAWTGERSNYRMWGLGYDANGNLTQLRRRGLVQTGTRLSPALFAETDNLHYRYDPANQGNRLQAVDDGAPVPTTFAAKRQPERPDFTDVSGSKDYTYDTNGSLLSDANKKLTSISYNHLHLPEKLVFATATAGVLDSLRFVYTATGQKVAKLAYDHTKPGVGRTDYLGAWQYEADTLRWLSTATDRALREYNRTSGAVTYNYEYTLKDHLGNLRVAFRRNPRRRWLATMEPAAAAWETQDFEAASVSAPIADNQYSTGVPGTYAARLNAAGATPQPIGPTRLWAVQGGDTLRVETYAYSPSVYNYPSWHFVLPTFLAGWLSQPTPTGTPAEAGTRRSFGWLQVGLAAGLSTPSFSSGVPHAYLRLLVYQADSTVLLDRPVPLTSQSRTGWERLEIPCLVLPPGAAYAQVYVADETNLDVWFDDLTIEHWPGLAVQETHYDPVGLDLAGLSRRTPGLKPLNQYQWNGKEKQTDFGLGWTNLDWRFFDPQLGRFHVVDPLSDAGQEMWSTYQFGFDNAIRNNDPDGRCPGGCPPIAQVQVALPLLEQLVQEVEEVLPVVAATIGATALGGWVLRAYPNRA